MNWVAIQTAAQETFGSSSSHTPSERAPTAAVASDSSSDEDNDVQGVVMAKNKKKRATKSITATQEKILNQLLHKWRANNSSAWKCLALTFVIWTTSVYLLVKYQNIPSCLLVAASIVRNFMILHDACHLSFFETNRQNVRLCKFIQYFSQFEWTTWQSTHNHHHRHLGDNSVIDTSLTVWFTEAEYAAMPLKFKIPFRIIRDPLVFFPVASAWVFFISRPLVQFGSRYVVPICLYFAFGSRVSLLYCLAGLLAGIIGLALFHLQHQVNTPYRVSKERRSGVDAGLYGSTLLAIRWPFTLMTLGIEFHHIHHASVKVPGYHLAACHAEGEALNLFEGINRVGRWRAFVSMFHAVFAGSVKHSHADHHHYDENHPPPSFAAFWPYSALGLYDQTPIKTM